MPSPHTHQWEAWLQDSLDDLQQRRLLRTLRPLILYNSAVQAKVTSGDLQRWVAGHPPSSFSQSEVAVSRCPELHGLQTVTLFSSNDYLGLSSHPDVCAAAESASKQMGMGVRSSALVAGYSHMHRELEVQLAELKGTEDCLLFPTGFGANMATIASLAADSDNVAIFSDELNHASIIDGARLASRGGGQLSIYRHNDIRHLDALLAAAPTSKRRLVVTESLFSMDGDFADLKAIVELKRRHDFLLVVDEAHATLVCGDNGGGACEALGICDQVDIHVGTLSKAFGALGGFVAASRGVKQYLLNKGRPFVFSTSLPLPVVAAAQAAIKVTRRESWRQAHVWQLVERLGTRLGVEAQSPIIPLLLGPEEAALQLTSTLLQQGLHVPAIRPPTVPAGTSRLRVSLSAAHTYEDVDRLVEALTRAGASFLTNPATHPPSSRL